MIGLPEGRLDPRSRFRALPGVARYGLARATISAIIRRMNPFPAFRPSGPVLLMAIGLAPTAGGGELRPVTEAPPLEPGVTFRLYDVGHAMDRLYELAPDQTPNLDERRPGLRFEAGAWGGFEDHFRAQVLGYLRVDEPGTYGLRLSSDDGAVLRLHGREVLATPDEVGVHTVEGEVTVEAGLHPFELAMFENEGEQELALRWRPPGADAFVDVPEANLFTEAGVTRVVSPGRKAIIDPFGERRPGDGLPLEGVHPGFTVERVRPDDFEPQIGDLAFLDNGMLAITTFVPKNAGEFLHERDGRLLVLENVLDDDPDNLAVHEVADGLHAPLGAAFVDGALYVSDSDAIYRFTDRDGDGLPEHREVFADGWTYDNYHHFTFGLVEQDGFLYAALSTAINSASEVIEGEIRGLNGPNPPHRGSVMRVSLATGEVEYIAGGFRTPNGLGLGPDDTLLVSDNQGSWKPANRLDVVLPGRFYGYYNDTTVRTEAYPDGGAPSDFADRDPTPPALWLPQNRVSNSPTNSMLIEGGIFDGQIILGEFTAGGLRRACLERVDGVWQGAVFRFTQGFEVGVQRFVRGPDGCYYIGGTGSGGNWNWRGTTFGLQRLRPTPGFSDDVFEYHSITAIPNGLRIRFTQPIDPDWLADRRHYHVEQWRYEPTVEYGGPRLDQHRLTHLRPEPAADGRSVDLYIDGLEPEHVVHLRLDPTGTRGQRMWSTEAWYTLNRIPPKDPTADYFGDPPDDDHPWAQHDPQRPLPSMADPMPDGPTTAPPPDGAVVLFDGESLDAWAHTDGTTPRWAIEDGAMHRGGAGGHLRTKQLFGDVRLHLEWMCPRSEAGDDGQARGNSGVFFMERYEVQILETRENETYADGMSAAIYGQYPPRVNAGLGLGRWQSFDIEFRRPRFDDGGRLLEPARVTVHHNGVLVQDDVALEGPTRWRRRTSYQPHADALPLMLQDHGDPVRFRNVWAEPLE